MDVRSAPYSRYNPQYNKLALEQNLGKEAIQYIYAGDALGGRPKDQTCYQSRQNRADTRQELDTREVMKRAWFKDGISRLMQTAERNTTVILCSEEDPASCHRHHLIAEYFLQEHFDQVEIRHIRGDGTIFSAASLHSALNPLQPAQLSFFRMP